MLDATDNSNCAIEQIIEAMQQLVKDSEIGAAINDFISLPIHSVPEAKPTQTDVMDIDEVGSLRSLNANEPL